MSNDLAAIICAAMGEIVAPVLTLLFLKLFHLRDDRR